MRYTMIYQVYDDTYTESGGYPTLVKLTFSLLVLLTRVPYPLTMDHEQDQLLTKR
jgi:hypothetical protein